jgi:transcriptional regulator with XRE-family HTH domain
LHFARSVEAVSAPNNYSDGGNVQHSVKSEAKEMAKKLSAIARIRRITQAQLAIACGVSRVTINRYFCGHCELRASEFILLLTTLGIPVHETILRQLNQTLSQDDEISTDELQRSPSGQAPSIQTPRPLAREQGYLYNHQ